MYFLKRGLTPRGRQVVLGNLDMEDRDQQIEKQTPTTATNTTQGAEVDSVELTLTSCKGAQPETVKEAYRRIRLLAR